MRCVNCVLVSYDNKITSSCKLAISNFSIKYTYTHRAYHVFVHVREGHVSIHAMLTFFWFFCRSIQSRYQYKKATPKSSLEPRPRPHLLQSEHVETGGPPALPTGCAFAKQLPSPAPSSSCPAPQYKLLSLHVQPVEPMSHAHVPALTPRPSFRFQ